MLLLEVTCVYHYAEVLEEVLEFAKTDKEKSREGIVYIQEKEIAPGGDTVLGDEDLGDQFEEQIRLILETTENRVYYADVFDEMLFYKQALEQLEQLKAYYPFEWISEEDMEKKKANLSNA